MIWSLSFLSTPSARRATPVAPGERALHTISIHALREEGDVLNHAKLPPIDYFYPRPPRGGRRSASSRLTAASGFLSTPSARRATKDAPVDSVELADFYPRPPRGGRRAAVAAVFRSDVISIHALREEGDVPQQRLGPVQQISIHALREEGDQGRASRQRRAGRFLSTPSARRATRCCRCRLSL